jgi:uncharacterized protein (UPF0548 family)
MDDGLLFVSVVFHLPAEWFKADVAQPLVPVTKKRGAARPVH